MIYVPYSFVTISTDTDPMSVDVRRNWVQQADPGGSETFGFQPVLGGVVNQFGIVEVELTDGVSVSSGNGIARLPGLANDPLYFAFTIHLVDGSTLDVLQTRGPDSTSPYSDFVHLGGTHPDFPQSEAEWDSVLNALDPNTPATPLPTRATFKLSELPKAIETEEAYREPAGSDTFLFLADGGQTAHMGDGVDYVVGGDGDDWISATGPVSSLDMYYEQRLEGRAGNDTLKFIGDGAGVARGGPGNDRIFGGQFDDRLYGDGGNNFLSGGGGNDRLMDYNDGPNPGNDRLYGGEGDDYLRCRSGNDVMRGNEGNDLLEVLGTDDSIDRVYGDEGDDEIHFLGGSGFASGGDGNDTLLVTTTGQVVLWGGSGADCFRLEAYVELLRIRDFEPGNDKVDVSLHYLGINLIDKSWGTRVNLYQDSGVIANLALYGVSASELSADDFIL